MTQDIGPVVRLEQWSVVLGSSPEEPSRLTGRVIGTGSSDCGPILEVLGDVLRCEAGPYELGSPETDFRRIWTAFGVQFNQVSPARVVAMLCDSGFLSKWHQICSEGGPDLPQKQRWLVARWLQDDRGASRP